MIKRERLKINFDLSCFVINFDNFDNFDNFIEEFTMKTEYFNKYYFDNEINYYNTIVEITINNYYID